MLQSNNDDNHHTHYHHTLSVKTARCCVRVIVRMLRRTLQFTHCVWTSINSQDLFIEGNDKRRLSLDKVVFDCSLEREAFCESVSRHASPDVPEFSVMAAASIHSEHRFLFVAVWDPEFSFESAVVLDHLHCCRHDQPRAGCLLRETRRAGGAL